MHGVRPALVLFHRVAGLALAGFLLFAGLTGALLAWYEELDAALNPELFLARPPTPRAPMLDPYTLHAVVQAAHPEAYVAVLPLRRAAGRTQLFPLHPRPAADGAPPAELSADQVFIDPYTGRIAGQRKWGDITQGRKNLMPFVYRLHYTLALGDFGGYLLGVVALLWTLDCFVGAWLTFPRRAVPARPPRRGPHAAPRPRAKPWLARWWPAWKVRWSAGAYKLNHDLHRAGGLWPWAMLLVFAWSSVAFNLTQVYEPLMASAFEHQPASWEQPPLAEPRMTPAIGWAEAHAIGRRLVAEQAAARGFSVRREDILIYDPRRGIYRYDVQSDFDIRDRLGDTRVSFDGNTGAFLSLWLPTGGAAGDTIRTWITSLHMAALWGVPMKLFVCAMGLAVAVLSVTGVVIWLRKRRGRTVTAGRSRSALRSLPQQ